MTTLTLTFSRVLPVWEGGPEQLCEISTTNWWQGPTPNDLAAHLEQVRADNPPAQILRKTWGLD